MNALEVRLQQFGRRVQPLLRAPAEPRLAGTFVIFNAVGLMGVLGLLLAGQVGLSLAIGLGLALAEIVNIAQESIRSRVPICVLVAIIGPVGIFLRNFVH